MLSVSRGTKTEAPSEQVGEGVAYICRALAELTQCGGVLTCLRLGCSKSRCRHTTDLPNADARTQVTCPSAWPCRRACRYRKSEGLEAVAWAGRGHGSTTSPSSRSVKTTVLRHKINTMYCGAIQDNTP